MHRMRQASFVGHGEWANGIGGQRGVALRFLGCMAGTLRGGSAAMNPAVMKFLVLLTCSNVFMTFAWYAHLRDMKGKVTVCRRAV